MKAVLCEKYGPPKALQYKDAEKPAPTESRVIVKVHAASVNAGDWHLMRGKPSLLRPMMGGITKPKDPRFGSDIAGRVESIGANVTKFKPGDEVFGTCQGAFAEYASAREDRLALKPSNASFEEAAAIPVAGITALQGLRDKGHIQRGQKVLINGATGGVGTFAVQIAKAFGAEVTGVCSTSNLDLVRKIGADHVIDYTQEDFTRNGKHYDLIYDLVGNYSISDYKRALNPNGICRIAGMSRHPQSVSLAALLTVLVMGPLRSSTGNKKVGWMGIAKIIPDDLMFLKELVEEGKITPVIERRYPLSETAEAVGYLGEGHARGKIIITIP